MKSQIFTIASTILPIPDSVAATAADHSSTIEIIIGFLGIFSQLT
ncbi:MAG: hypothetical protein V7K50_11330 [Nostoc sp.]